MTQLLDEEDQQLTLKILEAEEKRKCILREKKKISAGLDEMKRLNERSRVSLRKEKEALEVEKVKRLQVERDDVVFYVMCGILLAVFDDIHSMLTSIHRSFYYLLFIVHHSFLYYSQCMPYKRHCLSFTNCPNSTHCSF